MSVNLILLLRKFSTAISFAAFKTIGEHKGLSKESQPSFNPGNFKDQV